MEPITPYGLSIGGFALDSSTEISSSPRVWLLVGEKRGDNAQVENLARAIGWAYEEKKIIVEPRWRERKPWVRPALGHVDLVRSDRLEAPWPDLVITAGRRLSSVGLWIKQVSQAKTRLVLIGRPRRLRESIDLAVVAAHNALPDGPNVARHELPLMQVDPRGLERATAEWRPRLAGLSRPLTALMVGGPTGGLRFDLETARALFEQTLRSVEASGGSLYVVTSRRTTSEVVEMLKRVNPDSARLYVFDPDSRAGENPYHALLGLADHFVVTTDSISMMVEVARLGRPLSLFALESEIGIVEHMFESLGLLRPLSPREDPIPAGGWWSRMRYRLGRPRHSRDLSAIPRLLVDKDLAGWLGDEPVVPNAPYADDDLQSLARRIRALFESDAAGGFGGA